MTDNREQHAAELRIGALRENLPRVIAFMDEHLEGLGCPMKIQLQLDIAVEEIFVNIASYAYGSDTGDAVIRLTDLHDPEGIAVTFIDEGVAFDPLKKADPDVTLNAEERGIGGLGIYMVRKSMDAMEYRREDFRNILTLRKYF